MASPAKKKAPAGGSPRATRTERARVAPGRSEVDQASLPEQELIGEIGIEGGPAFGAATRLRVRGVSVPVQAAAPEKVKVSITLDKPLVDEIRAQFGGRALSASINDLLYAALAQERLGLLVDEMEEEAGPPSAESYERVLAQWFAQG